MCRWPDNGIVGYLYPSNMELNRLPMSTQYDTITGREKWLLGGVLILAVLAYREIFLWNLSSHRLPNYAGWFFNVSDTSPQFLYLLVAGLLYFRRDEVVRAFHGKGTPWQACLFFIPGIILYAWGRYLGVSSIVFMSFLLVLYGTARLLSGKHLTRQILIPVLILTLAIPWPAVLINQIVFPLQLWTAEHSVWLLDISGFTSFQEGDRIILPDGNDVRVAESCTALGFMKWLLIFALAYVYLFPVSRMHAFMLVLSAPFIAYAVNLLRAYSLIINPGKDILSIHVVQGVVFFMIGFALLYAIDNILNRLTGKNSDHANMNPVVCYDEHNIRQKHRSLFILAGLFLTLFILSIGLPQWSGYSQQSARVISLKDKMSGWEMQGELHENRLFLGGARYSSSLYRHYARNKDLVTVFIGINDRQRRDQSLISGKNVYPKEMWLVEDQFNVVLDGVGSSVRAVVTNSRKYGRMLSYCWYQGVAGAGEEILRALLALDQSPLRRPGGELVIRLTTNIWSVPQGRAIADKRLRAFLEAMQNQN